MKVGTGVFNYKEKCLDCGESGLVDINGYCKECFKIEMKGGLKE